MLKGLRKFSLAAGVVLIATGLIVFSKLNGDQYVTLVSWVVGLFFGANASQAVGLKIAEKPTVEKTK